MQKELQRILEQFKKDEVIKTITKLTSGHINITYLITTHNEQQYVLQQINTAVFTDVAALQHNKVAVSEVMQTYYKTERLVYDTIKYIATQEGNYWYVDKALNHWNMMLYIPESKCILRATQEEQVYEAGKLFAHFHKATADLDPNKFYEIIPGFHDVALRYEQLEKAIKTGVSQRKEIAASWIKQAIAYKEEMHLLNKLKESKAVPLRMTHNDTKISNILFDMEDKGKCVIDLDTVMPGIVHYDFGDAVRSICATANEDEKELAKIAINLTFYEAFCKGYAAVGAKHLTTVEKEHLVSGVKTMIYIMAIRFLTDYLNGDVYYNIVYKEHNLVRAKNQFTLLASVEKNLLSLEKVTQKVFGM
ncbi:phosphotransferase enzyme family protein [Aquimarina rhabdastrellae]